jgi:hypothetical protein
VCPAEDTIGNRALTIAERFNAIKKKTKKKADRVRNDKANLPDTVELAIGMEVMVTFNVETDLDVARVEKIILDRRETVLGETMETSKEILLAYPPECVQVKLYRTKAQQLPGLAEGVIPIVPMERKFALP